MKFTGFLMCIAFFSISGYSQAYRCLPAEINEDTVVRVIRTPTPDGMMQKKETVRQKLKHLKAKCSKGRLIDAKGKGIRFYNLVGCWGNPPYDYLEIQQRQRNELAELKKRFTVIEISCDVGTTPLHRNP